jgi:hypothetical protein
MAAYTLAQRERERERSFGVFFLCWGKNSETHRFPRQLANVINDKNSLCSDSESCGVVLQLRLKGLQLCRDERKEENGMEDMSCRFWVAHLTCSAITATSLRRVPPSLTMDMKFFPTPGL